MRIGFDATILSKRLTGVGIYTKSLITALLQVDSGIEIVLFSHKDISFFNDNPRVEKIIEKSLNQQAFIQGKLKGLIDKHSIDVFHGPNFYLPRRGKTPMAVTVHDLSAQFMPSQHSLKHRLSQIFLKPSLKRADRIITVSKATEDELVRYYSRCADKIHVVYNGVSDRFSPAGDEEKKRIKKDLGLPERFILFVGTLEPRKNLRGLLLAYAQLREKFYFKLVIAGGKGWMESDIPKIIAENKLENDVLFTGYIDSERLPALYSTADIFAYPSFYEGFGLPPLEAMACGTPVVTSNRSSLPEVAGDAAILVDPDDVGDIAVELKRIIEDEELRNGLIKKGLTRAKKFTWDRCATKTLAIYRELI